MDKDREVVSTTRFSETYERALSEGKRGVMYVCELGRSRGVTAAWYAKQRGEEYSEVLPGGAVAFLDHKNPEQIEEAITQLCKDYILRIFPEGLEQNKFTSTLQELATSGKIKTTDFENISIKTIIEEMKKGGQAQEIGNFSTAMLMD